MAKVFPCVNKYVRFVFSNADNNLETKVLWQKRSFAIEFEYDKGFEYERSIDISALPEQKKLKAKDIIKGGRILLIEEVHNSKTSFYEVYFEHNGKREKCEF